MRPDRYLFILWLLTYVGQASSHSLQKQQLDCVMFFIALRQNAFSGHMFQTPWTLFFFRHHHTQNAPYLQHNFQMLTCCFQIRILYIEIDRKWAAQLKACSVVLFLACRDGGLETFTVLVCMSVYMLLMFFLFFFCKTTKFHSFVFVSTFYVSYVNDYM